MSFYNDYSLYPKYYEPATEGIGSFFKSIGSTIKNIIDKIIQGIKKFGNWLFGAKKRVKAEASKSTSTATDSNQFSIKGKAILRMADLTTDVSNATRYLLNAFKNTEDMFQQISAPKNVDDISALNNITNNTIDEIRKYHQDIIDTKIKLQKTYSDINDFISEYQNYTELSRKDWQNLSKVLDVAVDNNSAFYKVAESCKQDVDTIDALNKMMNELEQHKDEIRMK